MPPAPLSLDLNLLYALDALLQERNVTRAGERLGLSQPSMSAALARLRRHFGDVLLERVGSRYALTPLAVELAPRVTEAVHLVHDAFRPDEAFDPTTSTRDVVVVTSDYVQAVLGPSLVRLLGEEAPNMRLHFNALLPEHVANPADVLRISDVIIMPRGFLTGLPSASLWQDRWVCISWTGSPVIPAELTAADLVTFSWVSTFGEGTAFTPAAKQLQFLGLDRRSDVHTDSFLTLPRLVIGGDRLALVQERLLSAGVDVSQLAVHEVPARIPPLIEAMWWHESRDDRAALWVRNLLKRAAAQVERVWP